jgi:hypothetical protein
MLAHGLEGIFITDQNAFASCKVLKAGIADSLESVDDSGDMVGGSGVSVDGSGELVGARGVSVDGIGVGVLGLQAASPNKIRTTTQIRFCLIICGSFK